MLMLLPIEELEKNWPTVLPYVERALAKTVFPITPENIYGAIEEGRFKLFYLMENDKIFGVGIYNICEEFDTQYLNLYLMSYDEGYTDSDTDLLQTEKIAELLGIKYITYYGRLGFHRRNTPKGWKVQQVFMVKEL